MTTIASQITSLTVVYSTVYSDADQRKQQSSASLAFVWGIHRDRWIPRTKTSYAENIFIWWRHHVNEDIWHQVSKIKTHLFHVSPELLHDQTINDRVVYIAALGEQWGQHWYIHWEGFWGVEIVEKRYDGVWRPGHNEPHKHSECQLKMKQYRYLKNCYYCDVTFALWRHLDHLVNCLFSSMATKRILKPRITGRILPVTGGFPPQRAIIVRSVSVSWRDHDENHRWW